MDNIRLMLLGVAVMLLTIIGHLFLVDLLLTDIIFGGLGFAIVLAGFFTQK